MSNKLVNNRELPKLLLFLFITLCLALIYFSFLNVVITNDSVGYYRYLSILKGTDPLSSWLPVRGPVMPTLLYLIVTIFGDNIVGFLTGTFLFLVGSIGIAYFLILEIVRHQSSKIFKTVLWGLFVLLFVFNPIIIGYFHAMLTEFVAIVFALGSCFLAIKWISINVENERKKFVVFSLLFVLLTPTMWFLKQPYVVVIFFPLFLGTILSFFKTKQLSNILSKAFVLITAIVSTVLSVVSWDAVLDNSGSDVATSKAEGFLTDGLIRAVSNFRKIDYEESHSQEFVETSNLDNEERMLIEDIDSGKTVYNDYNLYNVVSVRGERPIDIVVVPDVTPDATSFEDVLKFYKVSIEQHPIHALSSYAYNYGALINLYPYNYKMLIPKKRLMRPNEIRGENELVGTSIYYDKSTFRNSKGDRYGLLQNYKQDNPSNLSSSETAKTITTSYLKLLTFVLLIAPFAFVLFLVIYIFNKNIRTGKKALLYESLIVLFGYSFLHVAFHAFTGAIVDRYSFVAYPTAIIGLILLLNFIDIGRIKELINTLRRYLKV